MTDTVRSKPNINTDVKAWKRTKRRITPILNQLAVQLLPEREEHKSLLVMPDNLRDKEIQESQRFLVIAVGPTCQQIKEGNIVVGVTGIPMGKPPGIIHHGERLAVLIETQCLTVECDEQGNAVVMLDDQNEGCCQSATLSKFGGGKCTFKKEHIGPHQDQHGNRWSD